MNAFARLDRVMPPSPERVVFYGSSTIRLWTTLAYDFPEVQVSNRGFGGAMIRDVAANAVVAIGSPAPRTVIMYAGGNDLSSLRPVDQVESNLRLFVDTVLGMDEHIQIGLMTVIPHRRFWPVEQQIAEYNARMRQTAEEHPRVGLIDTAGPMLKLGAPPPADLFIHDEVHLSQAGYDILIRQCRRYLSLPS
ncbi:GDSL-type esterase/lipase family protein [Catellatospora sp. IY07-71]|uniref:GDSL-type esterase/lipase family protein n=1 Tax=Catellatospora sp. IY07-71 TaxID=2728827 RepID=UPI001BB308C0|nr:GDSL-type esterase/lipase family protein [Catellatospora sp. IY07-71]